MLRRLCAALMPLVGIVAACSTVVPIREAPGAFIAAHAPALVWITKTDNSVVPVAAPKVMGDTLTGLVGQDYVEMPLSSVQSMRVRQPAPKRTALLVGGATLAAAGAIAAYLSSSTSVTQTPECNHPTPGSGC